MFGSERCANFLHVSPGTAVGEPGAKLLIMRPQHANVVEMIKTRIIMPIFSDFFGSNVFLYIIIAISLYNKFCQLTVDRKR